VRAVLEQAAKKDGSLIGGGVNTAERPKGTLLRA
jgi:hypothetical protein